jgi:hypothetical protein
MQPVSLRSLSYEHTKTALDLGVHDWELRTKLCGVLAVFNTVLCPGLDHFADWDKHKLPFSSLTSRCCSSSDEKETGRRQSGRGGENHPGRFQVQRRTNGLIVA